MTPVQIANEETVTVTAPVSLAERLPSLDVLRGFALLGILVLNIQSFASPAESLHDIPLAVSNPAAPHYALNLAVMTIGWLFFEGKMRALFAVLFGGGSALLLDRIERRSGEGHAADIFHRRNMWLLFFGLVHGALIWAGDILSQYSSVALLTLYPLRRVSAKKLIGFGFAISLLGGTLGVANFSGLFSNFHAERLQEAAYTAQLHHQAPTEEELKAIADAAATRKEHFDELPKEIAEGRGSYLQSEPGNASGYAGFVALLFKSGWILEVLGAMIAGMGLYRIGFLSARLPSRTYVTVAAVGYAISVPTVLIGIHHSQRFEFSDAVTALWMFLPYGVEQNACMLANASVVLLLVRHGALMPVQRALAAIGRTAFTNYILTSVVCQFLFSWGPWKLYGVLDYYQELYVVAGVWVVNLIFSNVWLRFFAFGPLEWAWRSLTYWKSQPILLGESRS